MKFPAAAAAAATAEANGSNESSATRCSHLAVVVRGLESDPPGGVHLARSLAALKQDLFRRQGECRTARVVLELRETVADAILSSHTPQQ